MGKLQVVVGGQFGSEGKGAVSAALIAGQPYSWGVRVAGPNAGHTVIGDRGYVIEGSNLCEPVELDGQVRYAWKLRCIPVAAVVNPNAMLMLAAGSEIDPEVLLIEMHALDQAGYDVTGRLVIDRSATVLEPKHREQERYGGMEEWCDRRIRSSSRGEVDADAVSLTDRIGSTGKGIGAARAARIWREAEVWGIDGRVTPEVGGYDTGPLLRNALRRGDQVQIEGTQGYGLGIHTQYYPTCTSSDCRAIDFMAMAGLSPWAPEVDLLEVWVCLRTRPIRVAGNSGPLKDEGSWEQFGLPEERTTVTNKVRRVGEWDAELAREAVLANGGGAGEDSDVVRIALTMADQLVPELAGKRGTWEGLRGQVGDDAYGQTAELVDRVQHETGAAVRYVGTGPDTAVWISPSRGRGE